MSIGGREIAPEIWRLRKARNLIEILALTPNHRLAREHVIDFLWPDLESDAAANNLRYARHVARRILDAHDPRPAADPGFLTVQGDQVILASSQRVWIDVVAFEEAAAVARQTHDERAYQEAIDHYGGDLLPDSYDEWVVDRRQTLREAYGTLLLELAGIYEQRNEFGRAIDALRRAVDSDPANEVAQAALIRVYAKDGRRSQALRQYQTLRDALQHELDVEPDPTTQKLYADILSNRFPSSRGTVEAGPETQQEPTSPEVIRLADETRPNNLPAPLTSFIGREAQVAAISESIRMTRLLTLTGLGGSGKTRLAIESADRIHETFPDGIWLVELAPLNDPALIPVAIATTLGIPDEPRRPIISGVIAFLRDKQALLVLDNCEHLLDACAIVAGNLLKSCRGLRILATSREPLHLPGEMIWPVPPLDIPDTDQLAASKDLQNVESVRLFVERARFSHPGLALTEQNAQTIAEICRRLEGLPLAIELAAAWTRMFSVEQILSLLDDNLRLLSSEQTETHPRHRTLSATAEWSYNLLSEPERVLFRRLAVFAGGCSLGAAQVVCDIGDMGDVLARLAALVDKNLLVQEEQHDGEPRFRMQDVIRMYALQRLEESGEIGAMQRRHAEWITTLGEHARAAFDSPDARLWLDRLERERNNIRAALGWAIEQDDDDVRLRLGIALYGFWYVRGPTSFGARWLERALERSERAPSALRIMACYQAGELLRTQGEYTKAKQFGEESLALAREMGDPASGARALFLLANTADSEGDHERAITLYEASLKHVDDIDDVHQTAITLNNLAETVRMQGDVDRAATLLEEALRLWRACGSKWGMGIALVNLGEIARHRGEYDQAEALTRESLMIMHDLDDKWGIADGLRNLAEIAISLDQPERATRLTAAAEALHEAIGITIFSDDRQRDERVLATAKDMLDSEAFDHCWNTGRSMTLEEMLDYALGEAS